MFIKAAASFALVASLGLTACTNPYDPGQRAVGGGLLGAGAGSALGAIAGGGPGAAIGAIAGGALGAIGGAATTPVPVAPAPYYAAPPPPPRVVVERQVQVVDRPVYVERPYYAPPPPPGYYRGYGY